MTAPDLAVLVMAGGLGTRMRSATPKHLHPLLGRRMIDWVLEAVRPLEPRRLIVVASPASESEFDGVEVAVQNEPRGTGDAVAAAREALGDFDGDVLVVPGDGPLVTTDILREVVDEHRGGDAAVTLLTFEPEAPLPYGRVIRAADGNVRAIVEEGDASPEEAAVPELNASIYVYRSADLWSAIDQLDADNAQGELYLTDTVGRLSEAGKKVAARRSSESNALTGVNTRAELALAAAVLRDRINEAHMLAGVTLVDPGSTWIEAGVELEPDSTVHPFTVLRGRTSVAAGAEIGPHAVAVDAKVGPGATVGPFCYLRPGTVLDAGAKAGTFVEIKNSHIGERAKVPHLSYVGDADVGEDTNIGAGAITGNYRPELGPGKQRTRIGRNVHTASHNVFLAPVEIGDDAWTAAGSVITEDVPPGALAIARSRQINKEGYADRKHND